MLAPCVQFAGEDMITLYTFGPYFGLPDGSPFVTKAMFLLKIAQEILRGWKVEFISLAAIADVDAATKMRSSLPRLVAKIFGSIFFQGGKFAIQGLRGNFA